MQLKNLALTTLVALVPSMVRVASAASAPPAPRNAIGSVSVQLGPRPFYLVDDMASSPLSARLATCAGTADTTTTTTEYYHYRPSRLSMGHRGGAALQFPEHSLEANMAGARMGAGVLECDVAFTADRELVCRHSQCDLHQTTNIVAIPELNAKCAIPFSPATIENNGERVVIKKPATAKCCTSDITLAEFKTLCAKMDGFNASATTPEAFLRGTANWRTDLYGTCATPISLKEHIALVERLGLDHSPELKAAEVAMPFQGGDYTQEMYAQQIIDAYKDAGVPADRVWPQSLSLDDILYWMGAEPDFGSQAMLLDETGTTTTFNLTNVAEKGVKTVAPPLSLLLALDEDGILCRASMPSRPGRRVLILWRGRWSSPVDWPRWWTEETITTAG